MALRERVRGLLNRGIFANTQGFSGYFTAFGRQHVPGVWLTSMQITGAADELMLSGRSQVPELVPRYLQRLSQEKQLAGIEFQSFQMNRPKDHARYVEFTVRTGTSAAGRHHDGDTAPASARHRRAHRCHDAARTGDHLSDRAGGGVSRCRSTGPSSRWLSGTRALAAPAHHQARPDPELRAATAGVADRMRRSGLAGRAEDPVTSAAVVDPGRHPGEVHRRAGFAARHGPAGGGDPFTQPAIGGGATGKPDASADSGSGRRQRQARRQQRPLHSRPRAGPNRACTNTACASS